MAVNGEVLAAVSNSALITPDGSYGMLRMWIDGCKRSGVKNFMVIAIDDPVGGVGGFVAGRMGRMGCKGHGGNPWSMLTND